MGTRLCLVLLTPFLPPALAALEDVTVPADTFTDCPRFDIRPSVGAGSDDMKLWVADGVGEVCQIERKGKRTNDKVLEAHRVGRPRVPCGP